MRAPRGIRNVRQAAAAVFLGEGTPRFQTRRAPIGEESIGTPGREPGVPRKGGKAASPSKSWVAPFTRAKTAVRDAVKSKAVDLAHAVGRVERGVRMPEGASGGPQPAPGPGQTRRRQLEKLAERELVELLQDMLSGGGEGPALLREVQLLLDERARIRSLRESS